MALQAKNLAYKAMCSRRDVQGLPVCLQPRSTASRSMQFGTVKHAPSESEDDIKFFGTGHTHNTDARGVRVGGATGSSAELIAWKSQLTSSSRHRAMCQPKQGQEGTSCLKRACHKKAL